MGRRFRTSEASSNEHWKGRHRFEHWYRDNSVYFITARCRDRFPAFAREDAKTVFWERFELAAAEAAFQPWVVSLVDNHYHALGYLPRGEALPRMMKLLHGGVSRFVNQLLEADGFPRLKPFFIDARRRNYFDGCLRNERQGRLTYRYVLLQGVRHGHVRDWRDYPHTRVWVTLEEAISCALTRNAFMEGVRYKRYEG